MTDDKPQTNPSKAKLARILIHRVFNEGYWICLAVPAVWAYAAYKSPNPMTIGVTGLTAFYGIGLLVADDCI